ncbi:transaldolase family protein, partial [Arthrospira platensis SPKY2]
MFAGVHDQTAGRDGYVSVEVDPGLAHDPKGTLEAGRRLHELVGRPNVMIKIPATHAGLQAVSSMIAEQRSVNVTLIFGLDRYRSVLNAYLDGLERLARDPAADLAQVSSVASFF